MMVVVDHELAIPGLIVLLLRWMVCRGNQDQEEKKEMNCLSFSLDTFTASLLNEITSN